MYRKSRLQTTTREHSHVNVPASSGLVSQLVSAQLVVKQVIQSVDAVSQLVSCRRRKPWSESESWLTAEARDSTSPRLSTEMMTVEKSCMFQEEVGYAVFNFFIFLMGQSDAMVSFDHGAVVRLSLGCVVTSA